MIHIGGKSASTLVIDTPADNFTGKMIIAKKKAVRIH
jgi:hypothetical protein